MIGSQELLIAITCNKEVGLIRKRRHFMFSPEEIFSLIQEDAEALENRGLLQQVIHRLSADHCPRQVLLNRIISVFGRERLTRLLIEESFTRV